MTAKVSIIVPTYCTNPKHLKALVDSVDAQTLPAADLELIFVDDGSPDDTFSNLTSIASSRPRTVVKQIPNSGWPCRPRNVGLGLARGEFVFFMDHDDLLYPLGLEKSYELAIKSNADIVNPKEAKSKGWAWGWDIFAENRGTDNGLGVRALLPMTPHKLYRRRFLTEHEINFEVSRRLMWEDIRFNVLAYGHGARVAVLGEYSCYHWVSHGRNSSSTFGSDPDEKWRLLESLLQYFGEVLPPGPQLDEMLRHTYRVRFLSILGDGMLKARSERLETEIDHARELAARYIPESLDPELSTIHRARSRCLQTRAVDTARALAIVERNITLGVQTTGIEWRDTALQIGVKAALQDRQGNAIGLRWDGDSLHRDVDDDVRPLLDKDQLDFSTEVGKGRLELGVKARETREDWHVGVGTSTTVSAIEGRLSIAAELSTCIDIRNGLYGRPFGHQAFDVSVSAGMLGRRFHRGLPVTAERLFLAALMNGIAVVAYKNRSGLLTVDVGETVRSVASIAGSPATDVDIFTTRKYSRITLSLTEVHVVGLTRLEGEVVLRTVGSHSGVARPIKISALLIGEDGQARIETVKSLVPVGKYSIATRFNGRTTETGKVIAVVRPRRLIRRLRPLRSLPRRVVRKAVRSWFRPAATRVVTAIGLLDRLH